MINPTLSTLVKEKTIIISLKPDIDNYNYNYYITENENKHVYLVFSFVYGMLGLGIYLWKLRGV